MYVDGSTLLYTSTSSIKVLQYIAMLIPNMISPTQRWWKKNWCKVFFVRAWGSEMPNQVLQWAEWAGDVWTGHFCQQACHSYLEGWGRRGAPKQAIDLSGGHREHNWVNLRVRQRTCAACYVTSKMQLRHENTEYRGGSIHPSVKPARKVSLDGHWRPSNQPLSVGLIPTLARVTLLPSELEAHPTLTHPPGHNYVSVDDALLLFFDYFVYCVWPELQPAWLYWCGGPHRWPFVYVNLQR